MRAAGAQAPDPKLATGSVLCRVAVQTMEAPASVPSVEAIHRGRHRPRHYRQHVLPELQLADHNNAGLRAWRIPAFKRDPADAVFARFDGGKTHRGLA
jgi:hypothetical protein